LSFDIHGPDLLDPTIGRRSRLWSVMKSSVDMIKLTVQICALLQSIFVLSSAKVGLGKTESVLSSYKLRTALKVKVLLQV
jgi:hypothetical protein